MAKWVTRMKRDARRFGADYCVIASELRDPVFDLTNISKSSRSRERRGGHHRRMIGRDDGGFIDVPRRIRADV